MGGKNKQDEYFSSLVSDKTCNTTKNVLHKMVFGSVLSVKQF